MQDIHHHFAYLQARNFSDAVYGVKEAVYEAPAPDGSRFHTTEHFKEPLVTLPDSAVPAAQQWVQLHGVYEHGQPEYKGAVRLRDNGPQPMPWNTDSIGFLVREPGAGGPRLVTPPPDAIFLHMPCVLHYPSPTLGAFVGKFVARSCQPHGLKASRVDALLADLRALGDVEATERGLDIARGVGKLRRVWEAITHVPSRGIISKGMANGLLLQERYPAAVLAGEVPSPLPLPPSPGRNGSLDGAGLESTGMGRGSRC